MKNALKNTPYLEKASNINRERMHDLLVKTAKGIEFFPIGRSIRGRELLCYKFGKGRGRVAFFGAHHALESITTNILYAFVCILHSPLSRLICGEASLSHYLSLYTYYVLPCLNPDGIELRLHGADGSPIKDRIIKASGGNFSRWQANERGVDLNHNYDAGFLQYKRIERERGITEGAALYSGEYPESEPETRAAANFVRIISPMAIVSLHSQGEEIFYSPDRAAPLAARLSRLSGYKLSTPTDTAAYGGLCDYTGASLGIPSFTFEVGRGKNPLAEALVPDILTKIAPALFRLPSLI